MAQQVKIANVTYNDVPLIQCPDANGVFHKFVDVSSTTATQNDVAFGKTFFDSSGNELFGSGLEVVSGIFTADTSTGIHTLNIPYSGSGYPVEMIFCIADGMYNSNYADWYNLVSRYAVGLWVAVKDVFTSLPTFTGTATRNYAQTLARYKNSTSSATSYTSAGGRNTVYSNTDPTQTSGTFIKFYDETTVKYFTANGNYGFAGGCDYEYFIRYRQH